MRYCDCLHFQIISGLLVQPEAFTSEDPRVFLETCTESLGSNRNVKYIQYLYPRCNCEADRDPQCSLEHDHQSNVTVSKQGKKKIHALEEVRAQDPPQSKGSDIRNIEIRTSSRRQNVGPFKLVSAKFHPHSEQSPPFVSLHVMATGDPCSSTALRRCLAVSYSISLLHLGLMKRAGGFKTLWMLTRQITAQTTTSLFCEYLRLYSDKGTLTREKTFETKERGRVEAEAGPPAS